MPNKPVLASKGVWGGIIASFAGVVSFAHTINVAGLAQAVSDNWPAIVSMAGGLLAAYGRIRANAFIAPAAPKTSCIPAFLIPFLAIGLAIGSSGCATVAPGSDPVVVRAEQTTQLALDTFNLVEKTEFETYASIKAADPATAAEIRTFVNGLRRNQATWLQSARTLTRTYKENRSPENKASLNTALAVLQSAIDEANKYLAQMSAKSAWVSPRTRGLIFAPLTLAPAH